MTIDHPVWVAIIGTLAVARLARLVVFDEYPPMLWLRLKWFVWMGDSGWKKLLDCAFCAAPYLAAGDMAWAYFTDFQTAWWAVNIWLALSYLSAIVVARDEPED